LFLGGCGGFGCEVGGPFECLFGLLPRSGGTGFSLCAGLLKGVGAGRFESLDGIAAGGRFNGPTGFFCGALGCCLSGLCGFSRCLASHRRG
jgi:hypothetical protein